MPQYATSFEKNKKISPCEIDLLGLQAKNEYLTLWRASTTGFGTVMLGLDSDICVTVKLMMEQGEKPFDSRWSFSGST